MKTENTAERGADWTFRQPHYLRLNLAIGGDWGGMKGIDDAPFPIPYEIDFVRLYKRAGQS